MSDVAIAIDGEAVSVKRAILAPGHYTPEGDWVRGAPTSTFIRAAIQPLKGNQLMDMPEGIRTEAGWVAWSRSAITLDDEITSGSIVYRVLFVWPRAEGGFYRAALSRVTP